MGTDTARQATREAVGEADRMGSVRRAATSHRPERWPDWEMLMRHARAGPSFGRQAHAVAAGLLPRCQKLRRREPTVLPRQADGSCRVSLTFGCLDADQYVRSMRAMRVFLMSVMSAVVIAIGSMLILDQGVQRKADQAFGASTSVRLPSHGNTHNLVGRDWYRRKSMDGTKRSRLPIRRSRHRRWPRNNAAR